jgi:hypothetical protein
VFHCETPNEGVAGCKRNCRKSKKPSLISKVKVS